MRDFELMLSKDALATRAVAATGSAMCLASPFLFWVGRGQCGWTCYTPAEASPVARPGRLDDAHIGWHVAPAAGVGLVLIALIGLWLASGRRPGRTRHRSGLAAGVLAVAGWVLLTAVHDGSSGAGLARGGFVGAFGAVLIAGTLLAQGGRIGHALPRLRPLRRQPG